MFKASVILSLVAVVLSAKSASALSIRECAAFEQEHEKYVASGIKTDMARGPEWAKGNLPANRVQQVLRFLFLEEQLRFRCETVFAEAELVEMALREQQAAQAKALANIPPPPNRRPEFARVPKTKRYVLVPPLPSRRDQTTPQMR